VLSGLERIDRILRFANVSVPNILQETTNRLIQNTRLLHVSTYYNKIVILGKLLAP